MKRIALAPQWHAHVRPCPQAPTEPSPARVIDGDSLVVSGARIRILDVDAPDCKCEVVRSASDWAKAEGVGIWSSAFSMPWEWRAER
jgi:endonuclease YncB( thermonuclease family)